jgi:hypothetical protein
MSAGSKRLHEILDELHELLETDKEMGDEAVGALKQAADEIRGAVGTEPDGDHDGLREQLNGALERLEGRHPKLTELVGRVADALSDIGI